MKNRISDDPRNLARELEAWNWARAAGVSDQELRKILLAGPKHAPRRRSGERQAAARAEKVD